MKQLTVVLEELGLTNVKTYIQSGNVVFQSKMANVMELSHDIRTAIGQSHGFTPQVLLISMQELQQAIAANPFPKGVEHCPTAEEEVEFLVAGLSITSNEAGGKPNL